MARRKATAAIALAAIVVAPILPTWGVSLFGMPIVLAVFWLVRRSGRPVRLASLITGILIAMPFGLVGSLGTAEDPSITRGILSGILVMGWFSHSAGALRSFSK